MTIFELIREEVSARQVAELYGLRFDKSGRGFCPWHDDGKHAALKFFDDGRGCYCHACHMHGDAVSLDVDAKAFAYRLKFLDAPDAVERKGCGKEQRK